MNKPQKDEATPLYIASYHGQDEIVRLLLSHSNIDINKNPDGYSALGMATQRNHTEVVQLLTEAGAEYSILDAVGWNDVALVQKCLNEDGCDVNQVNSEGCTPLFIASGRGHVEIIQTLLTRDDIDVNKPNEDGRTPLWMASYKGHVQIVQTLLTRDDIDVNKPTKDGVSPFFVASQQDHVEIVTLLLSLPNIDVNQSMPNGASPLIISVYLGHASCVKQLLSHCNIDTTLVFQEHTAFHWCQADSRADGWEFLESKINVEGRVNVAQTAAGRRLLGFNEQNPWSLEKEVERRKELEEEEKEKQEEKRRT